MNNDDVTSCVDDDQNRVINDIDHNLYRDGDDISGVNDVQSRVPEDDIVDISKTL